nr:hypothetical protein [Tanacetum cinerariifolium]
MSLVYEYQHPTSRCQFSICNRLNGAKKGLVINLEMSMDRPDHRRTSMLMDREAMYSCEAWAFSMDMSSAISAHVRTLETQVAALITQTTSLQTQLTTVLGRIKALIDRGVAVALAERDADRSRNGDNINDSGTGTEGVVGLTRWIEKMESVFQISNCTVVCQVKFASCTLQGCALTWWNSHMRAVGQDVAYAIPWAALKRMITSKYWPRELALMCERMFPEEAKKEAIEFATEMMDKKMLTHAERQAEHKRKLDDTSRNNQQQQPFKRNNVARAYTTRPGDKKPYVLFDTGVDRSFVSIAFSSLIDIIPTTLDHGYDVKLADGRFSFFIIAVQTPGSGISILLAVGTPSTGSGNLYCQWELSPGSGNALCILFPTARINLSLKSL